MHSRIALISDDSDFFEYIVQKLVLRKSDELFCLNFNDLPENLDILSTSVLVINSENAKSQTAEIVSLLKSSPVIVFAYNQDEEYKINLLKNGALAFITPLTSDDELQAQIISALHKLSVLQKNKQYREILVAKNLITTNNEVFLDYNTILDKELEKINETSASAVLAAISPNEKTKFLIQPNQIETIILNNIRKNDVLMSFAVNKYFLILYDTDIEGANKIWAKISAQIPEKIYAGFVKIFSKTREQLVNEALNKLHEAINYEKVYTSIKSTESSMRGNFKLFKQEFNKKIEQIINPVFYHVMQKYNGRLYGVTLEHETSEGLSILEIKGRYASAAFKITSPGFTRINIDITYMSSANNIDAKRISLNPDELESGLLEDLVEQFIMEFKEEVRNA